jgi:hypothetical protein
MKSLFILFLLVPLFLLVLRNYDFQRRENSLNKSDIIKKLLRQASRWSIAAEQDELPMVAVLHANYGTAYLWSLKEISTNDEIEKITGVDMFIFEKEITRIQDEATRKVYKACPQYGPELSSYLVKLST